KHPVGRGEAGLLERGVPRRDVRRGGELTEETRRQHRTDCERQRGQDSELARDGRAHEASKPISQTAATAAISSRGREPRASWGNLFGSALVVHVETPWETPEMRPL